MQQTAANTGSNGAESLFRDWTPPSSSSTNFAGLLASLMSPDRGTSKALDDDDLADDVATLSYADALRTHSRYKPSTRESEIENPTAGGQTCTACGAQRGNPESAIREQSHGGIEEWHEDPDVVSGFPNATLSSKKCASITIRMSKSECEQLKKRAAEAGLTISAYLRSCTFEAEALRAEVKRTLADLRRPVVRKKTETAPETRGSWFEWLLRFMPHWHMGQRVVRA
jgi:hypothetical protein